MMAAMHFPMEDLGEIIRVMKTGVSLTMDVRPDVERRIMMIISAAEHTAKRFEQNDPTLEAEADEYDEEDEDEQL